MFLSRRFSVGTAKISAEPSGMCLWWEGGEVFVPKGPYWACLLGLSRTWYLGWLTILSRVEIEIEVKTYLSPSTLGPLDNC